MKTSSRVDEQPAAFRNEKVLEALLLIQDVNRGAQCRFAAEKAFVAKHSPSRWKKKCFLTLFKNFSW